MDKNFDLQNEIENIEYRSLMEEQFAKDFWFMNIKKPDPWDSDFDWSENCFPMEWGVGWYRLFYNLCKDLLIEVKSDFQWTQLKEKYGRANCYYSGSITPYGEQLIAEFEKESETICEHCGKPGKLRGTSWYMTLCDECWKKSEE